MRTQPRKRINPTAANPHAQMPRIAIDAQSRAGCFDGRGGTEAGKGSAICMTVSETTRVAAELAAGGRSSRLPRLISRAKGKAI